MVSQSIGLTYRRLEPFRYFLQQRVARTMSKGVVNQLELVEVNKKDSRHLPVSASPGNGVHKVFKKEGTVG